MLPLRLTAKMRKACSPLPQTVPTPRSRRQMRQHVFLNFFACRLCWRRKCFCRNGFLVCDFFRCLHVIWIHGLVFILRSYGRFSCLGKSTGATSTLCSYGVKLTASDLFHVDTFFFAQPDPFVRAFVKHATLSRLGIQDDSLIFAAYLRR